MVYVTHSNHSIACWCKLGECCILPRPIPWSKVHIQISSIPLCVRVYLKRLRILSRTSPGDESCCLATLTSASTTGTPPTPPQTPLQTIRSGEPGEGNFKGGRREGREGGKEEEEEQKGVCGRGGGMIRNKKNEGFIHGKWLALIGNVTLCACSFSVHFCDQTRTNCIFRPFLSLACGSVVCRLQSTYCEITPVTNDCLSTQTATPIALVSTNLLNVLALASLYIVCTSIQWL